MRETTIESCGCEFLSIWDNLGNSMTILSKCKCEKHFKEQFVAEWYDHEGYHNEIGDLK